jgi:hypothetical protein
VVYAGSSDAHFVHAVDARSGEELWRYDTARPAWSSPAVAGEVLFFGDGAGRLHAVERKTGKGLWTFRTGSQLFSSPAVAEGVVYVGSTDGGVYAIRTDDGPAVRRVVFYDSAFQKSASEPVEAERVAQFLRNRGYTVVGADSLAAFVRDRTRDREPSVVVFAMDHLPAGVAGERPEEAPLRRYLEAGGKVVWAGLPPLFWPRDPKTGNPPGDMTTMNWSAPSRLLGVAHDAAIFDARGVRPTPAGSRWGLDGRWRSAWSVDPRQVTEVLAVDEWGLASSWVKSFGGAAGTGFVRVHTDPATIYFAAEFRPEAARPAVGQ